MAKFSDVRYWRSVFRRVLSYYDEKKSVQGTMSCTGFYNGLANESQRVAANPRVVRTLPEDFFADVERAARKSLNAHEWAYFKAVYLEKLESYEDSAKEYYGDGFVAMKHSVQEKVGKMLLALRIYPIEKYFKPKDIR